MPEGDTIHRAAARLRPALVGHTLTRFEAARLAGDRPRPGETIETVEARGKHLLIGFSGGLVLRTHMRMTGSWHLYRDGERWQKGAHLARAVVGADSGWVAVCFQAPVVEIHHREGRQPDALAGLGPDLTAEHPDIDAVLARVARSTDDETEVADALLDQRLGAGIGNVYKSEVLFLHGIDPFTAVASIEPDRLRAVYETAHRLLRANLSTSRRVTYRGGVAVYGRKGQPCKRCGTVVRMRRQGPMARSTYWCPECQSPEKSVVTTPVRE
ncbi:Fpg/Nei family DNA glycosylase [Actinospongicola halichondriae]|uniref:Fpg/Nei family DNA glycosylase n=1 Tax=Actinospongicola halichondriae TaxID=3236844 RepID=UPI003D4D14BE